jgi:hypothetical protein
LPPITVRADCFHLIGGRLYCDTAFGPPEGVTSLELDRGTGGVIVICLQNVTILGAENLFAGRATATTGALTLRDRRG